MTRYLIDALRWVWFYLGFGTVHNGAVCAFSAEYYDRHDYPVSKGGDGTPSHFYTYNCWQCGAEFTI